jgi:hypothetical protein
MKTRLTQYFNYLYIRFIVSINYFKAWTINNPLWLLPLMLIFTTILLFHHYIIDNRILDLEFVNNEMLVILTFFISPLLLQVTYNYFTLTLTSNKVYLPFSSSIKNILDLIINSIFPLFIYLLLSVSSILHIITSGEYYSYIFYVFLILTAFSLGYYLYYFLP